MATDRQRQKALRMLEVDPRCRATLAELREAARDVAAVLPLPVAAAEPERTRRVFEVLTDSVDRLLPGSRRAGRQLAESVVPSGAAEPSRQALQRSASAEQPRSRSPASPLEEPPRSAWD